MQNQPPFDSEALRLELLRRFNDLPGVRIPPDGITRRPGFPLDLLKPAATLAQFLEILDWIVDRVRSDHSAPHDSTPGTDRIWSSPWGQEWPTPAIQVSRGLARRGR
jgi:hypothetical protein